MIKTLLLLRSAHSVHFYGVLCTMPLLGVHRREGEVGCAVWSRSARVHPVKVDDPTMVSSMKQMGFGQKTINKCRTGWRGELPSLASLCKLQLSCSHYLPPPGPFFCLVSYILLLPVDEFSQRPYCTLYGVRTMWQQHHACCKQLQAPGSSA